MNNVATTSDNQRLIPVSAGRFAMWLFLSTEVMFFAGVFASYIVLRAGAFNGIWPEHEWVNVHFSLGLINTLLLTLSSVAAWLALKANKRAARGKTRMFVGLTILLGSLFLAIKAYEYKAKFDLGIRPVAGARQVFDRADIYYLASVRQALSVRRTYLLEKQKSLAESAPANDQLRSSLEELGRLRSGLLQWAEQAVARTDDPQEQQRILDYFARQIYCYDTEQISQLKDRVKSERSVLKDTLETRQASYETANQQVTSLGKKISELADQRRKLEQSQEPVGDLAKQKLSELTLQITQIQRAAGEAKLKATALRQNVIPLEDRMEYLESVIDRGDGSGGVNQTNPPIGLPLVIPSGGTWMNLYYLMTGLHAVHVLAGLLVFLGLLVGRLTAYSPVLGNCVLYWHFVDVVWIIMFAVIYF